MSRRALSRTSKQHHQYKCMLPLSRAAWVPLLSPGSLWACTTARRLHAPEQHPEGRSSLKRDIQILSLIGKDQITHICISDLHCKLLNLPQLWLKMPMLRLQRAEPGTAAKALGCSESGTVCTMSPHTSSARAPLSKWEGSPSPDTEQSPCMGLMTHSSIHSTVQGWSCIAALTHERLRGLLLLAEVEKSLRGPCSLTSHSSHHTVPLHALINI